MPAVNSFRYSAAAGLIGMTLLSGCSSMPQGVFPMHDLSRVPAPGTGTYNLPGNYYGTTPTGQTPTGQALGGQTSMGQTPSGQAVSGQPGSFGGAVASSGGLQPLSGSLPTTNLVANSNSNANSNPFSNSTPVQPAQFTSIDSQPSAMNPVQTAGYTASSQSTGGFGTQTFSAGRFDDAQSNAQSTSRDQPSNSSLSWK